MKPLKNTVIIRPFDPASWAGLLSEQDRAWLTGTQARCRSTFGDLLMMAGASDDDSKDDDDGSDDGDDDSVDQDDDQSKDRRSKDSGRAGGADALKADLNKERRARQQAQKKIAALEKAEKDRADADLSELEKARKEAAEAKERAAGAERKSLLAEIAMEKGLPAKLARRLTGTTREELEADADELLELLPKRGDSGKDDDSDDDRQKKDKRPKPDRGQGGGSDTKRSGIQAGLDGYKERYGRRTTDRST